MPVTKTVRQARRSNAAKIASDASKERFAAFGADVILRRMKQRKGPRAWCNTCHRFHRRGDVCRLYLRTRTSKSGGKIKVWAH